MDGRIRKEAAPLAGWDSPLVRACAEGLMGDVWPGGGEPPAAAAAVIGDFIFLAGRPDAALLARACAHAAQRERLLVPREAAWHAEILRCCGERAAPHHPLCDAARPARVRPGTPCPLRCRAAGRVPPFSDRRCALPAVPLGTMERRPGRDSSPMRRATGRRGSASPCCTAGRSSPAHRATRAFPAASRCRSTRARSSGGRGSPAPAPPR